MPAVPGKCHVLLRRCLKLTGTVPPQFISACIYRMFGRDPERPAAPSLAETLVSLSDALANRCGFRRMSLACAARRRGDLKAIAEDTNTWHKLLPTRSGDGAMEGPSRSLSTQPRAPSVSKEDIATQLEGKRKEQYESLKIIDSIAWCWDLLPKLTVSRKLRRVAVHPTCSITDLGLVGPLKQIAGSLADEVEVPIGTTCCGTAGDRGLLHPELVVSATREVRLVLIDRPFDAYLSANRICEMGLRHATGRPYESFVFLLEELSRPQTV